MPDYLSTFITAFQATWNSANTSNRTPSFVKRHNHKIFDLNAGDFVAFYPYADEIRDLNAFGYATYKTDYFLSIEVWTAVSDAHSVLMKDEIIRVMNNKRLDLANTGFHFISQPKIRDDRDSFRKIYKWVLDYEAKMHNASIQL